jgi:hypothetical protein
MTPDKDKKLEEELERLEEINGSDSEDEMKSELERLRAENEALKKSKSKEITFKVGQKGGMSLYGLGRFPVTLYKSQWLLLLDAVEEIRNFIKIHDEELK